MLKDEVGKKKKKNPFLVFVFYFTIFPSFLYFTARICFSFRSLPSSLTAAVQFSLFSGHHRPLHFLLHFCEHNSHFDKALPNPLRRKGGFLGLSVRVFMATLGESSSAPPKSTGDKPVIVRVKRKAFQSPLDAFCEFEFSLFHFSLSNFLASNFHEILAIYK